MSEPSQTLLEGWLELRRYLLRDGLFDGGDEIRPRQQRELDHRLLHRDHRASVLEGFKGLLGRVNLERWSHI